MTHNHINDYPREFKKFLKQIYPEPFFRAVFQDEGVEFTYKNVDIVFTYLAPIMFKVYAGDVSYDDIPTDNITEALCDAIDYITLCFLKEQGLVKSYTEDEWHPNQEVFYLTEEGKKAVGLDHIKDMKNIRIE